MYKNLIHKNILSLLLAIFSLFFFVPTIHAYEWVFMVYMDGDNNLESYAIDDFLEMAQVGSNTDIAIVVQLDRYDGAGGYGNWTDCARFLVQPGDTPVLANADYTWPNGHSHMEVNMGDTQTLVDFVDWATGTYTAQNYALILWDHGDGWRESIERLRNELRTRGKELSLKERETILNEIRTLEQKVQGREHVWKAVCFDDTDGDALNIREIREALATLQGFEIHEDIDLIGFDACLMGMLEVAYEIKDYGTVMVASEKTEPGDGWPYNTILGNLKNTPTINAEQLGSTIVTRYGESYEGDNTLSAVQLKERTGNYSASDLQDTWLMHSLESGDPGPYYRCSWSHSTIGIDGSGNMTFTSYQDSDGDTSPEDAPDTAYITSDGIVTVNDESFNGVMSQDKSIVVGTVTNSGEGYELIVLQKGGGTFATSNLQGTWNMHSLSSGDSSDCSVWSRGTVNINGSGNMTWTYYRDSDGHTSMEDPPITVSINSEDGTVNVVTGGGDNSFHGVMSLDKSTIVGTAGGVGEGCYELIILQKSGGTFEQSNLKGAWNMHSLWSGDSGQNGWSRGTINIDGSGNMTFTSYLDSDEETSMDNPPLAVLITSDGIVTVVDTDPSFHGVMSLDKSMVVGTVGDVGGGYELIVLQKSSGTFATIGTLSNAVSTFTNTVIAQDTDWDVIFSSQQRAGFYEPYLSYRDLKGFIEEVIANPNATSNVKAAAEAVNAAFEGCIIANHSSVADKGHGLSIYFPEWFWGDEFYEGEIDPDYNGTNLLFLHDTGGYTTETKRFLPYTQYWDDFLHEYVSAYLVPSHTGIATYSRSVPGGTTASAYVMISSPVNPGSPDPIAELQDDLGNYDPTIWRLFRWEPMLNTPGYEEYPYNIDEEEVAKAYWLISRNTVNIDITGNLEETNSPFFIPLYPGWNQIGTPFNFDIDWDTVQVATIIEPYIYYVVSPENDLTSQYLWKYVNGDYSSSSASAIMEPGEGYWVNNLTYAYLWLIVNPVRSTLSRIYIDSLERTLTVFAKSAEETPPSPPGGIDPEPTDEGNNNGGSGSSKCFIATACFGSPLAGEVEVLRNFRDKYLLSNSIGKIFVSTYYRYSPPIAKFIGNHKFLKIIVRSSLYPVVKSCKLTIED